MLVSFPNWDPSLMESKGLFGNIRAVTQIHLLLIFRPHH